ncbi:MAG: DUF262 domain-containing protein [Planctomycetota bacterium]|nr:DUF262 domain-containing protein [Planctomycetota bacterium]
MTEPTTVGVGERVTFRKLFDRHPLVEIPIIQRDYAQGRPSAVEIRTEFLKAIHSALEKPSDDPSLPLDLDFVYGSVESGERQAFCPLDGQQRLTTLFLLHWYLAWKDAECDDLAAFLETQGGARLLYAVRPSSDEFFDALVRWRPDLRPEAVTSLAEIVRDQPWFFRSWTLDPTIQSALTMLEAIHRQFGVATGFYRRLVQADPPYITFQLLDLRSFGLSDDLYIKMNARGKPLTPFETFKARLEQQLDALFPGETVELHGRLVSKREYFSTRIDTVWADLFWHYRDQTTQLFDNAIMNLLRVLAIITRNPDSAGVGGVLEMLRDRCEPFAFGTYHEAGCLDNALIDTFMCLLDCWSGHHGGIRTHLPDATFYDEEHFFRLAIDDAQPIYSEMVRLWAYVAYIRHHRHDLKPEQFSEWMRVICNLAVNTPYDGLDEFQRSIRSINALLPESDRVVTYLASTTADAQGFYRQQVREERLKAQLMARSDSWRNAIIEAERHGYFQGQIEFLFKFAGVFDAWVATEACDWDDTQDAVFLRSFREYLDRAASVFAATGLRAFGEQRWERCLLAAGDYLLSKGRNYSFLDDGSRDTSWKRLLRGGIKDQYIETRRGYVKQVLDQIDPKVGVAESLDVILTNAKPAVGWRKLFVDRPELIEFCWNRMVRWESENRVYLLRKIRMSGEHAELFTYHLYLGLLAEKHRKGELTPFGSPKYATVTTDSEEPYASLAYNSSEGRIALHIENDGCGYELTLFAPGAVADAVRGAGTIEGITFKSLATDMICLKVARNKIENAIDETVRRLKASAGPASP